MSLSPHWFDRVVRWCRSQGATGLTASDSLSKDRKGTDAVAYMVAGHMHCPQRARVTFV